jgi:hypothetical protein
MNISELKSKLDFYVDAIYQKGFDYGFETVIEELDSISDRLWNDGHKDAAEIIRGVVKLVKGGFDEENL